MSKDIPSFIPMDVLFCTHFQEKEASYGTERTGKGAFYLFRCKDLNSSGILFGLKYKLPSTGSYAMF